MSAYDSIAVSTVVAVDAATAFAVFTGDIGAWWRSKAPRLFGRDREGVLKFEASRLIVTYDDAEPFLVGRVLAWDPGRRLVFEWRQDGFTPDESTEVEVRFEPAHGGTRVTVEHRGWDAIPPDHPARRRYTGVAFTSMIGLRWADVLTAFRARASGL
ncbi:MAG TPA: SRPBCC domain-containing protein [Bryobacteraceae bacterium]